jgi:FkbM family methyltransferase
MWFRIKKLIRNIVKAFGYEIFRYYPCTGIKYRVKRFLNFHNIDLVIDVGANTGQYAKGLRKLGYKGKIISFEPLSSPYSELLSASAKDNLWEIAPRYALGDREGEIGINISENSVSSSILPILQSHVEALPASKYVNKETVRLRTLDSFLGDLITDEYKSILLKMDVQGYESFVLQGATQTLKLIKGLQLELSVVPLYENQKLFCEMIDDIEKLGFGLNTIIEGFKEPVTYNLLQIDCVFYKK